MNTKRLLIPTLSALCLALLSPAAIAQTLQLRDGTLLVGRVQDATDTHLVFERLDTGGKLRVRWDQLTKASAERIKAREGLLVESDEDITVAADVLRYSPGGIGVREIVGRIVDEDDTTITIRRRGTMVPIRRSTIKGRSQREVSPREIFTTNEYYLDLFQQASPGEDADKHLQLADSLVKVRDYSHAELHMLKADKLGGGRQPHLLKAKLQHLALLKESAAERTLLDEIRTWQNRGDFKRASAKLAEFQQRFPDTKLKGDLERAERLLTKTRERYYVFKVAKLWYRTIGRLGRSKAAERNLALADARTYCERQMGKEIREHIAMTLEIEVDEVELLWPKRLQRRGPADSQQYYYGVGSWILGAEEIIKDTKQGKAEQQDKDKKSDQDRELERLRKRIADAIRRAQRSGPTAGGNKKQEISPEDWWKKAPRDVRLSFIRAYYVEHSGDLEIVNAYLNNCPNCGGRGRIPEQMTTGQTRMVKCSVCHGTRFKRRIRGK